VDEEWLSVGQVADRSGFAASAIRYYEGEGLISAERNSGGQRRFHRSVLRRLAFISAARHLGVSLEEARGALEQLPQNRTPNAADWKRISLLWREKLNGEIRALEALRDGLDSCIGCGCLSLDRCKISNPHDAAASRGPGAVYLPKQLRVPAATRA
jgi:MerR family redox-sensitive transcriptional activator SoxR